MCWVVSRLTKHVVLLAFAVVWVVGSDITNSNGAMVPDTASINSDDLKAMGADKFLSLWFIFVLSGATEITEQPWTILIPINSGLPGPGMNGFLTSRPDTRSLLLNHVILGQSLQLNNLPSEEIKTKTGTALRFTKSGNTNFVNGVRITGEEIKANGGTVLVIEKFIPVEQSAETDEAVTVKSADIAIQQRPQTRRRGRFGIKPSTTTETIRTTPETRTTPKIERTTTETKTTVKKNTLENKSRNSKRTTRPSPLFKSSRNKNTSSSGRASLPIHQRVRASLVTTAKPAVKKPESKLAKEKSKSKIDKAKPKQNTETTSKSPKPKVFKLNLRERARQRLQRSRNTEKNKQIEEKEIKSTTSAAPKQKSITQASENENVKEKSTTTVKPKKPRVAATRFDKFKSKVRVAKEREELEKDKARTSHLLKLARENNINLSITTSQPEATTQREDTTETTSDCPDCIEIERNTMNIITEKELNTKSNSRKSIFPIDITTETIFDFATISNFENNPTEDQSNNDALSTTFEPMTERATMANIDTKEAGILAAFSQFVKSPNTNKPTAATIEIVEMEGTRPNFDSSHFELMSGLENKHAAEMVIAEINESPEMHSLGSKVHSNSHTGYLSWLVNEIKTRNQLGGKEFLNHLMESGVANELIQGKKYTALVPIDEAFYEHYPIDWGFNLFSVKSFLKKTLREHLMEGDVALESLPSGSQLTTLAGTTLTVHNVGGRVSVDGVNILMESESTGDFGRLYSLPSVLHVTEETRRQLQEANPHLERAPLLGSPWPMSQFLSHLYQRTVEGKNSPTSLFAKYLLMSDLSHLATSSDENLNNLEYTALVLKDDAIIDALRLNNGLLENAETRNQFLGSHILKGRYQLKDLMPGKQLTTILNGTLMVSKSEGGDILIGGSKITSRGSSIYNLGAMFTLEKPVTLQGDTPSTDLKSQSNTPLVITRTEVSVSRQGRR